MNVHLNSGFQAFSYTSTDGLQLSGRIYGDVSAMPVAPVVCLAGLTRNVRDFHDLALHLSQAADPRRCVVSFDYRGRGQSDYDPNWANYNIGIEAGDVLAGLDHLGIRQAIFVGTSRGGLIAHILAAIRPDVLKAVVFNDIGPQIESDGLSLIRTYLSASRLPASWPEAIASQRKAHGADFPALADADWERFAHAIYRDIEGVIRPDFDPNLLKTLENIDFSKPLPDLWSQFDLLASLPVMVIRGENSRLLSVKTVEEMKNRHPGLEVVDVQGQGHAPLLETGTLPHAITAFINRADPA